MQLKMASYSPINLNFNIKCIYIQLFIVILRYNDKGIMGIAKSEIFSDNQNLIANFAKAFGHPARVAILQHIFKANACICGDLVNEIGLAQATISQHLKGLK